MNRTVLCHFFNEEYLLPWWLQHHKKIFDHGILIDYYSTDASCEIIRDICPTWQIVTTKNEYFNSNDIDREIEDYEKHIQGWRICLNVTEFLYGNYDKLIDSPDNLIYYLNNYVFIDNDKINLDHAVPLHEQITKGYKETQNRMMGITNGFRTQRRITNHFVEYHAYGGRHYYEQPVLDDLFIFYYGFMNQSDQMINRKVQIKNKISPEEISKFNNKHMNVMSISKIKDLIKKYHIPLVTELKDEVESIAKKHKELTGSEF